jgi:hypothetical protein
VISAHRRPKGSKRVYGRTTSIIDLGRFLEGKVLAPLLKRKGNYDE